MKEKVTKKMQAVKFQNIEELLAFLPDNQLAIVEKLRGLINETIPETIEYLSFNVPYYKRHKSICFIWPGAVGWGMKVWEGVDLGFSYGCLLRDEIAYLEKGARKQVTMRRFYSEKDINEDILRAYLFEALELDAIQVVSKKSDRQR